MGRAGCGAGASFPRGGADAEGAGGPGRASHRRCSGRIVRLTGGRAVGDDCALRAGGIHGEWAARQAELRHTELKGPDVAGWPLRASDATLVGRDRAGAGRDVVNGWAAIEQGQRLRGAPVVLQATRIELGVGVLQIARTREAARGPTLQVVALVADPTKWIG